MGVFIAWVTVITPPVVCQFILFVDDRDDSTLLLIRCTPLCFVLDACLEWGCGLLDALRLNPPMFPQVVVFYFMLTSSGVLYFICCPQVLFLYFICCPQVVFSYFICCKDPNRNDYVHVFLNCLVSSVVVKVPIEMTTLRVS